MTIFKWSETCRESVWQSQEDESVQLAVLWAIVSSLRRSSTQWRVGWEESF